MKRGRGGMEGGRIGWREEGKEWREGGREGERRVMGQEEKRKEEV